MFTSCFFAWLYWNPERIAFTVPFIERPVAWYGICFVFGFMVGYCLLIPMFQRRLQIKYPATARELSFALVDRLTWFVVGGTLVGARLGHVFFYEWPYYQTHPSEIYKIWNGGLASHGGAIGILLALFIYQRTIRKQFPELSFLALLDMLVVPTAFGAFCIRFGNFVNQEIIGVETTVPWAIVFGDPADGSAALARHPVQLYEAFVYLASFGMLYYLWKTKSDQWDLGALSGLFFMLIFIPRFFIEFLKLPQSLMMQDSFLQMGQYLSLPFILLGMGLYCNSMRRCEINHPN
jgi:phosphatidylglycerol:prolipoprotein diacylglycerol transferase